MITQEGVVTRSIGPNIVSIRTIQNAVCKGCSSHGSCEAAKEGEVEAINTVGAKVGDGVVVGFAAGSLIKISLLLYIFPVCCMILGAVAGSALAPRYGFTESALAAACAFGAFFLSFLGIRLIGGRLTGDTRYQARVIRVRRSTPDRGTAEDIACSRKT